ncbi:MAG: NADPH-dependent FMN reductase [Opitutales bacterium]
MITLISGTNRADSNTRKVVTWLERVYRDIDAETAVLDLKDLPGDLLSPDAYAQKPKAFQPFTDQVLASDGLVVVTPEYNGGFPGVLKLFIDMLPFPESFDGRPVAFVGLSAGTNGALRPVEQLQQIFGYRNAYIYPRRVFIPGVFKVLDDQGNLTDSDLADRLLKQSEGYLSFVRKVAS